MEGVENRGEIVGLQRSWIQFGLKNSACASGGKSAPWLEHPPWIFPARPTSICSMIRWVRESPVAGHGHDHPIRSISISTMPLLLISPIWNSLKSPLNSHRKNAFQSPENSQVLPGRLEMSVQGGFWKGTLERTWEFSPWKKERTILICSRLHLVYWITMNNYWL